MLNLNATQLMAASRGAAEAADFVSRFNDIILFPLVMLLTGIAMLYFIYGCVIYIANAENSEARETGRSHIIYSIVGMLIMLIAYALLTIAVNTFGLGNVLDCANNPLIDGCEDVMRIPDPGGGTSNTGTNAGGGSVNTGTITGG